jgi:hypothetical protein
VIAISEARSKRSSLRVWFFRFLAFHVLGFFVAGDDLHLRMLALFAADFVL